VTVVNSVFSDRGDFPFAGILFKTDASICSTISLGSSAAVVRLNSLLGDVDVYPIAAPKSSS